ncbi:hypothetical protein PtB15_4B710 [Puccinia triticina]|nr:hypothetical protein PtB15_4B710 [Puccinia triticina]
MWDAMTLQQKRAFATDPTVAPDQDSAPTFNPTGAAGAYTATTGNDQNPQAATTTDLVPPPQVTMVAGLQVCSKSLKAAYLHVDKWITKWQAKVVHVAKSSHSLVNKAKISLACEAATGLQTCLGSFVAEETNGLKRSWSWGDCDSQLGAIGFKLVFLPGAKSNPIWLKTLSRELKVPMITLINHNLNQNLICVVANQDALLGVVPCHKKNLQKKQPPCTTDDTNSKLGAPTTSADSITNQPKNDEGEDE